MARKTRKRATAKVFTTGRSQAVRIPKEYRFSCDEVLIEREGERVILTPRPHSWRDYFCPSVTLQRRVSKTCRGPTNAGAREALMCRLMKLQTRQIDHCHSKRTAKKQERY